MGMTWKQKVQGVGIAVMLVSALATTSGANWAEQLWAFVVSLGSLL
jgi:hypothetical protein